VGVGFAHPTGLTGGVLNLVPISAVLIGFGLIEVLISSVRIDDTELAAVVVAGGSADGNTAAIFGHIGNDVGSLTSLRGIEVGGAGGHRRNENADEHNHCENERCDFGFHLLFLLFMMLILKNG